MGEIAYALFRERFAEGILEDFHGRSVKEGDMRSIIQKAALVYSADSSTDLRLLSESYSHLKNGEFAPSFFLSWIITEKYLSKTANRLLVEYPANNSKEKDRIRNNANAQLNYLYEKGVISQAFNQRVHDLRRLRNTFAHGDTVEIREEEAKSCFETAKEIIANGIMMELSGTK